MQIKMGGCIREVMMILKRKVWVEKGALQGANLKVGWK